MATATAGAVRPALIDWPRDAQQRERLAVAGTPCLLVIDPGAEIPLVGDAEDWAYRTTDERDVSARLAGLARRRAPQRAPLVIPAGLDARDHRVAARLLASVDSLVPRADFGVTDLDGAIERLRPVLAADGWSILAIGAAGFLVERALHGADVTEAPR